MKKLLTILISFFRILTQSSLKILAEDAGESTEIPNDVSETESISFMRDVYYLRIGGILDIREMIRDIPGSANGALHIHTDEDILHIHGESLEGIAAGTADLTVHTEDGQEARTKIAVGHFASSVEPAEQRYDVHTGEEVRLEYVLYPAGGDFSAEEVTWAVSSNEDNCIHLDTDTGSVTVTGEGYAAVTVSIKNGETADCVFYCTSLEKDVQIDEDADSRMIRSRQLQLLLRQRCGYHPPKQTEFRTDRCVCQ